MPDDKLFRAAADLVFPPVKLGQSVWESGIQCLELIGTIQRTTLLTEDLLRSVVDRWEKLRSLLQNSLDWWVSSDTPAIEPTASSYFEAAFRRLERICRCAFYAGQRFTPEAPDFPLAGEWALDYELASAFIRRHIAPIDLAASVTGFRKEVILNISRPMCRLSWEPACIREWRFAMYMEILEATPDYHWKLDHLPLLQAIREPTQDGKEEARLTADPDTRAVYLDGRVIATEVEPDVMSYVSAVIAAHPHAIPFKNIVKGKGLKGKNQTRLRKKLSTNWPDLANLIAAQSAGHFLILPPRE